MPYIEEKSMIATKLHGVCGVSTVYDKERGVKSPSFFFVKDAVTGKSKVVHSKISSSTGISANDIKLRMQLRQNILSYLYYHPERLRVLYREELDIVAEIELEKTDIIIVKIGEIDGKYQQQLNSYNTRIKSWTITGMTRRLEGHVFSKLGMNINIQLMNDIDLSELTNLLLD